MIPPFARRFLAGETALEAIEHARQLQEHDVRAILNLLGEHYSNRTDVKADTRAYKHLITEIDRVGVDACLSVKPTQLGLDISKACFRAHLESVLARAAEYDIFVWIDMEDHPTTAATLEAFEDFAHDYDIGVCLQANLKRTDDDLERFADLPGKIRLVKGAYNPPPAVAHQSKAATEEAIRDQLRYMFREFDDGIALGSHDPELITLAADLHHQYGTPYELQMLMGVRTQAQYDLAAHHDVWQYAPYGTKWPSYFYRRLTERKENIGFALRALNPFQ